MEFTVNWSPQARDLLRAGKIQIDRWKCPDWDDMIAQARVDAPYYIHFPLTVGRGMLATTDWARVERMMRDSGTPHVNLHLEPLRSTLGDLDDDALVEACVRELEPIAARFGAEQVVLENVPYRTSQSDKFRASVLPERFTQVIRATGCRVLLDIGHARITSNSLGVDPFEYMSALPLDRIGELHIAGLRVYTQEIHDKAMQFEGYAAILKKYEGSDVIGRIMDHFGMESEADWTAFGWLLDRVRTGEAAAPRLIAFEYGGTGAPFGWRSESSVIERDVPRFYAMVHAEKQTI